MFPKNMMVCSFIFLASLLAAALPADEAASPAAVLSNAVSQMVSGPSPEFLALQVDWESVFRATPSRFSESYGIAGGEALKAFYLDFLRAPSKALMKPLQPLIAESLPKEKETVDRMVAAYESMNGWLAGELGEGLHSWKGAMFNIGEEVISGDTASVQLEVGDGRYFSDLSVKMVRVNGRWLLAAEWLPAILQDIIEDTGDREESPVISKAISDLYRRRDENREGLQ